MSSLDTLLAIILGLVLPATAAYSGRRATQVFATPAKVRMYRASSLNLWILGLTVVAVWTVGGRSLADLGIAAPVMSGLAMTIIGLIAAGVALDGWHKVRGPEGIEHTRARWLRDTPFMPADRTEFSHFVLLAVSAGICEELMFRGFLIRYLESLLQGQPMATPIAIALPALAFGVSHWYQGALSAAKIILYGAGAGVLFVVTSSLLLPILIHIGVDLAMGQVGVRLRLAESRQTS